MQASFVFTRQFGKGFDLQPSPSVILNVQLHLYMIIWKIYVYNFCILSQTLLLKNCIKESKCFILKTAASDLIASMFYKLPVALLCLNLINSVAFQLHTLHARRHTRNNKTNYCMNFEVLSQQLQLQQLNLMYLEQRY